MYSEHHQLYTVLTSMLSNRKRTHRGNVASFSLMNRNINTPVNFLVNKSQIRNQLFNFDT